MNKSKFLVFLFGLLLFCIGIAGTSVDGTKSIKGIDRVELVKALYRRANVLGMGVLQFDRSELSDDEARSLVGTRMDYVHGKVMKIKVPSEDEGDEIDTWRYNRDNGDNAAEEVVDALIADNCIEDIIAGSDSKTDDPDIIKLSDGSTIPEATFNVIFNKLYNLFEGGVEDRELLCDLVKKCRNSGHQYFSIAVKDRLISLSLIRRDGQVFDWVRSIVLSHVKGGCCVSDESNSFVGRLLVSLGLASECLDMKFIIPDHL